MDGGRASELASAWIRAHGERMQDVQGLFNWLGLELKHSFSDDAPAAVATVNGAPAVVAASDRRFVWISSSDASSEEVQAVETSYEDIALDPDTEVSLISMVEERPNGMVRLRKWTFRRGQRQAQLETLEWLSGGFAVDRGPSDAELIARAAAKQCGWPGPHPEPAAED